MKLEIEILNARLCYFTLNQGFFLRSHVSIYIVEQRINYEV